MPVLAIDLNGVTLDLLRSTDNPALSDAVRKATASQQPLTIGAGFDNKG